MGLTFTFTADSSGSKDAVTIPANANYAGYRYLKIRPPLGHAWSYSAPGPGSGSVQMGMDEEYRTERGSGEYSGGEIPMYVALDTGSGTFTASLE